MRPVGLVHQTLDFRVGLHLRRSDHHQVIRIPHDLLVLDLHVQSGDELSVGAALVDDGVVPHDRVVDLVVGVAAQQHVDAVDAAGELLIHAEPAVRDDHDEVRVLLGADVGNQIARFLFPESELPVAGRAENRRGERGPGIGETDDRHPETAHLLDHVLRECRIVPLQVGHVAGDDRKLREIDQLEKMLLVVDELPVAGRHHVVADGVHDLHHRHTLVEHRQSRAVPRISGVEQQGPAAHLRTQALDDGGHVRHAAELALQGGLGDIVTLARLPAPGLEIVEIAVVERSEVGMEVVGAEDTDLGRLGRAEHGHRQQEQPDERGREPVANGRHGQTSTRPRRPSHPCWRPSVRADCTPR